MTTRFTSDELMGMRAVKKAAAVLLILSLYDHKYPGRAYPVADIAADLDMDPRTVDNACRSLSANGMALFDGRGYVLTMGGRAMLLSPAPQLAESQQEARAAELEMAITDVIDAECADAADGEIPQHPAQNVQPKITARLVLETASGMDGFVEGIDLTKINNLDALSPRLAIGWLAHAYDQRAREGRKYGIKSPSWFLVSKLNDASGAKPAPRYYDHPRAYLPDEYMMSIGLPNRYACEQCEFVFTHRSELDEHAKTHVSAEAEAVQTRLSGWTEEVVIGGAARVEVHDVGGVCDAADAWNRILLALEGEMPSASYQTWVADTVATGMRDDTLTVRARNAFARDWLESRMSEAVNRLASAMLGRAVSVAFTVGSAEEE